MLKVIENANAVGVWQELILEAQQQCAIHLETDLEAYLVYLLIRYMNQPDLAKKSMADQFLTATQPGSKGRQIALQQVGDSCLLFSGLFPGIAKKRLVKISYFVNLGRGAYESISLNKHDLYHLLAAQFVPAMDVLYSIRAMTTPDRLDPLTAYDLWNETGSVQALKSLQQSSSTPISPVKSFSFESKIK